MCGTDINYIIPYIIHSCTYAVNLLDEYPGKQSSMGKSHGINTKAKEGRERKAAAKEYKKTKEKERQEEEEVKKWQVGVKTKTRKQTLEEERMAEKARLRAERDRIEALELEELSKYKDTKSSQHKNIVLKHESVQDSPDEGQSSLYLQNPNKLSSTESNVYSVSNIDDAIFLLDATSNIAQSQTIEIERHPERRMKAAFASFESRELPKLKKEFPTLRYSQLQKLISKKWAKSDENPLNKTHIAFNATKSQEMLKVSSELNRNLESFRLSD